MFTFAQDCWPDLELTVTDIRHDEEPVIIRCHRCVLATKFEWFRASFQHQHPQTDISISTDGLPFGPSDVKVMIEEVYAPVKYESLDLARFLSANVYFGRTDDWLKPTLGALIAKGQLKSKATYRIIRALLSVQGLNRPGLVRALIERYFALLPSDLRSKIPPFDMTDLPVVFFTGLPPAFTVCDDQKRTILRLEGTVSDHDEPVLHWNGLEYATYTTDHDSEIGVWLTCRPIGEELTKIYDTLIQGVVSDAPRHLVQVRLRLFYGLRPGGEHFSGHGDFLEPGAMVDFMDTYEIDQWRKADRSNFVLPLPAMTSGPAYQPARNRIGHIVNVRKGDDMSSMAYRFDVIVHEVKSSPFLDGRGPPLDY